MTFAELKTDKSISLFDAITGEDITPDFIGADFGEEMDSYFAARVDATEERGDHIAVYLSF